MSLSIRLTEPHVFVVAPGHRDSRNPSELVPSALVRGLLVLKLTKRTKITGVEVSLEGESVTDWPEGIGPRHSEVKEERTFLYIKTSLLDPSSVQRRAHSLGPGISYEGDGIYHTTSPASSRPTSRERNWDQYPSRPNRSESVMPPRDSRRLPAMQETIPYAPSPPYSPRPSQIFHTPVHTPQRVDHSHTSPNGRHILDEDDLDDNDIDLVHSQPFTPLRASNLSSHADSRLSINLLDRSQPDSGPSSSTSILSSPSSISVKSSRPSVRRASFDSEDSYSLPVDNDDRLIRSIPTIDDVHGASAPTTAPASSRRRFRMESPASRTHVRSPLASGHRASASLDVRTRLSSAAGQTYGLSPTVSRTMPAAPSIHGSQQFQNSQDANDERSRERGRERGRPSRFGWSAMSNLIRGVSQDVAGAVDNIRGSSARSASRGYRNADPLALRETGTDYRREQSFGRDDVGSSSRGRRERLRDTIGPNDDEVRGRNPEVMPLGAVAPASEPANSDGWTEFSKGTYTYPISFMIPSDSPPSLNCDFGHVSYRLKATVHRAGTFVAKLTASTPVTVVSCAGPDDDSDASNLLLERQWEDNLRYVVNIEGAAFPIGGAIPLSIILMPLDKLSIHRITVHLEEGVHYFAHGRKVTRQETIRRFELLTLNPPDTDKQQVLLPILSDSPMAAASSPLRQYARPELANNFPASASTEARVPPSEVASHLLNPSGPWQLGVDLRIPDCSTRIHFTHKRPNAQIVVIHCLKIGFRVSRGISGYDNNSKKPKMFDIIVEIPVNILSCQCQTEFTRLPAYSATPNIERHTPGCSHARHSSPGYHSWQHPNTSRTPTLGPGSGMNHSIDGSSHSTTPRGAPERPSLMSMPQGSSSSTVARPPTLNANGTTATTTTTIALDADAILRTEQFARLVAGQESEAGEIPPAYSSTS